MTLWFSNRPRIASFRPKSRPMGKNEEPEGLHARTQPDSEILTFEIEVSSSPNEEKTAGNRWKTDKATLRRTKSRHFPSEKRRFSQRKPTFWRLETYDLTTENLQSGSKKPAFYLLRSRYHARFRLQFLPFMQGARQQKQPIHWHPSTIIGKQMTERQIALPTFHRWKRPPHRLPNRHIYKGEKGTLPPSSTLSKQSDKPLLTINNPNGGLRMKKKEKLNLHDIPTYKTISYFCSAFGKQTQLG